ncbi:MAG TPA: hypothetical protein VL404_02010 [Candidatus Eisenbacteria bacterium]|jgi:hypothetical protein|nr:hypothetical protein [Candidatus Eisenbacteria bacterium]
MKAPRLVGFAAGAVIVAYKWFHLDYSRAGVRSFFTCMLALAAVSLAAGIAGSVTGKYRQASQGAVGFGVAMLAGSALRLIAFWSIR